tara:strand:- start:610 stop:981 length:372 start_codon:yes stop_codon:yes gene_type:complete
MFNLIVSYPKSGNTWVRFILYELFFKDNSKKTDSRQVEKYIPDFHQVFDFKKMKLTLDPVLKEKKIFLKTHFSYQQMHMMSIDRVILIVRNPLDVLASLINYYDIEKNMIESAVDDFANNHTL